jgi:asparagine synthase (glutamine-hydrolysing)
MHFKYRLISMLERQNKVCMSNSVENRVPFLDNKFVDFMFTLPEELLMYKKNIITDNYSEQYEGKYILKELSSQVYGKEFAYRKKQAIQVPWGKYFSEPEMIKYINEIIVPGMKKRNFIDADSFLNRLEHLNDGGNIVKVWKYINFELWCQFFIDGRTEFYP